MLKRLRLINFRRYPKLEIKFDQHLNIIEGENNAGKTTIFMGVEYALFGSVSGFKSQTELALPDSDEIGAELVYQGVDGKTYKLQRTHIIGARAKGRRGASGYFTLKEKQDDGESYILSSDFENNPEELLQLKIFETFGISKRLFNIAINVKQGEISEILLGKSDLDIVLGVSAAKIAEKSVRQIALGFENETSQYASLKSSLDTISVEKTQLERQKNQLTGQIASVNASFMGFQGQKDNFDRLKSEIQTFQGLFDDAFDKGEEWQNTISSYRTMYNTQKPMLDTPINQLQEKVADLETKNEEFQNLINNAYVKEEDINEQLRQYNQKLGDINGKLQRRQQIKGEANCEVCGAPIDTEQVKREISQWEIDMTQIQAQITVLNAQLSQLKSDMNKSRSGLNQSSSEIHQIKGNIGQIKNSEDQLNSHIPKIQDLENDFLQAYSLLKGGESQYKGKVTEWLETYGNEPQLMKDLSIGTWDKSEEKTVNYHKLEVKGSTISNYLELNGYNDQLVRIQETQIKQFASLDAKISGEKSRLNDLERMRLDIDPRIKRLEREMAALEKQLQQLHKKRTAALKLRTLSSGFKKLTTTLRNKSATQLAQMTWAYHKDLSGSDEYRSLSIDPKNYALMIEPKDIDQEVPAYYYQGGGHKLLLGLAYKFAISNLVTKPSYYLLDEPTYGLDNENKQKLLKNIQELAKTVQINLITHQREELNIEGQLLKIVKEDRISHMEVIS